MLIIRELEYSLSQVNLSCKNVKLRETKIGNIYGHLFELQTWRIGVFNPPGKSKEIKVDRCIKHKKGQKNGSAEKMGKKLVYVTVEHLE